MRCWRSCHDGPADAASLHRGQPGPGPDPSTRKRSWSRSCMAVVAAIGWLVSPFWLAVTVAAQLAIGGLGAVWLIGPARAELGFARYATLASAGVALTLFGRLVIPATGLAPAPIAALLLWGVIRLELDLASGDRRVGLDLALVGIVFAAAAGIAALVPREAWPPALIPLLMICSVPGPARRRGSGAKRHRGRWPGVPAPRRPGPDRRGGLLAAATRRRGRRSDRPGLPRVGRCGGSARGGRVTAIGDRGVRCPGGARPSRGDPAQRVVDPSR